MEEDLTQEDGSQRRLSLAPTIEDFEILKPISRGAFGKVFLCHRKNHPERKLAVKVMNKGIMSQKNMKDQVIAERNAAAIAKSDFCVGLLYSLQTTDNVFLVMEYMIGGDLKSLLGNYGFFPEHQAVFYLAECVLALQDLHRRGIVHRDIKPDNMLLSAQGHLKLTDFGLSTSGLQDRELQVTDLVGRTPWNQRHPERLVRTPGQILSLTSHLSFSNTPILQDDIVSVSGSLVRSSALPGSRTTSFTSSHISANTPTTAPASSSMSRRIKRKGSFQEAITIHTKEQKQF